MGQLSETDLSVKRSLKWVRLSGFLWCVINLDPVEQGMPTVFLAHEFKLTDDGARLTIEPQENHRLVWRLSLAGLEKGQKIFSIASSIFSGLPSNTSTSPSRITVSGLGLTSV